MSVADAQMRISSSEFVEWCVYDAMNPGEPERGDFRAAQICAAIINSLRAKGDPIKVEDCLLKFKEVDSDARRASPDEIKSKLLIWKAMHEAAQKRK